MSSSPQSFGMIQPEPDLHYRYSNRVNMLGMMLATVAGLIVGWIGAIIYAYFIIYIPIVYLNILAAMAFGAVVGLIVAWVSRLAKVRSPGVIVALATVLMLAAYYMSWCYWVSGALDRYYKKQFPPETLIKSPSQTWTGIKFFNERGTWTISKSDKEPVHGWMLWIVWLAEGLAIVGAAYFVAKSSSRVKMFCEDCNRWCDKPRQVRRVGPGDPAAARQRLKADDLSYLDTLGPPSGTEAWNVSLESCPRCHQFHAVSITGVKNTVDKKGRITNTMTRTIVTRLLIAPAQAAVLAQPPAPPETPPAPPVPPAPGEPATAEA